jgi:anti-sigma regulatory factor (Ser/Thr protein kinase)/CheY-like chemotaxis protein
MKRRLLILHPDKTPDNSLVENITQLGFSVTSISEPDRALTWTRQHQPELVILRNAPPQIASGLCETIKLDPATNLIPIYIITGVDQSMLSISGLQISPNGWLHEPFTLDQLRQAIEDAQAWRTQVQRQQISNEICFHLPSAIPSLERLTQLLESLFVRVGFTFDQIKRLKIAVRELGINAIEWGHRKEVDKIITVILRIHADRITLSIRDTGSGFDLNRIPHAARPGDPVGHLDTRESQGLREGGFGILLARGLVDGLHYNDRGNEACLVKYLHPRVPASETG